MTKPYTFFKNDGGPRPPTFDLAEFDSDGEALNHALEILMARPQYKAVEVWDGIHDPFTVERPEVASEWPHEEGPPAGA